MIVMKFGGTSVKDTDSLTNVAEIVAQHIDNKPLVVLSAGAGVTDTLISIARKAAATNIQSALENVATLRERHFATAKTLLKGEYLNTVLQAFTKQFEELDMLIKGVSILQELTPRVLDHFMSFGEQWSCLLLEQKLLQYGNKAGWIDSREVLITDNDFTNATPLFDVIENRVRQYIFPLIQKNTIVVTQGFIGATQDGITTTIGRGGSDYSAAIIGSLLEAREIQIWTDVSGVLTANPGMVPDARPVREMTFNEAAELAYFGATVLHPSTILPAISKKIPVRVLNSNRPDDEGTLITANDVHGKRTVHPNGDDVIKSIAHRTGITVIRIQSTRMLMAHGFLAKVFEIFARHKKSVDVIATSEVGISLTVDDQLNIDRIANELDDIADVSVLPEKAVISIVGEHLKKVLGIAGRAFTALGNAGVNVELISHGGSEINLTFVISEDQVKDALPALHSEFFSKTTKSEGREIST